jgi:hypothetical protein
MGCVLAGVEVNSLVARLAPAARITNKTFMIFSFRLEVLFAEQFSCLSPSLKGMLKLFKTTQNLAPHFI